MQYIKSNDGTKIAVYDYNPRARKTVFLIHGWPLSHKIYEYQINLLTEYGYRVVAVDLRGFGKSDAPVNGYSYNQMATDVCHVIHHLGLRNFILVGFSTGGSIALRYMNNYSGFGVSKLILLSAAAPCFTQRPDFPYGKTVEEVNDLINLAQTDRPQLCENFSRQLFASPQSDAAIDWFRTIALSASGIGTIKSAVSLRNEDGRKDLKCVHVPTYIIHGDKDIIVSNELVELQHQGICNSKLHTLSNSGHGITYDELEKFNSVFLNAIKD